MRFYGFDPQGMTLRRYFAALDRIAEVAAQEHGSDDHAGRMVRVERMSAYRRKYGG